MIKENEKDSIISKHVFKPLKAYSAFKISYSFLKEFIGKFTLIKKITKN